VLLLLFCGLRVPVAPRLATPLCLLICFPFFVSYSYLSSVFVTLARELKEAAAGNEMPLLWRVPNVGDSSTKATTRSNLCVLFENRFDSSTLCKPGKCGGRSLTYMRVLRFAFCVLRFAFCVLRSAFCCALLFICSSFLACDF